jgi:hypothetical protein
MRFIGNRPAARLQRRRNTASRHWNPTGQTVPESSTHTREAPMKRIHLLTVATFALAAAPAIASDDVDFHPNGFLSSAIRATQSAAAAERAAARADAATAIAPATKSRAQVAAETREAARLGLLNRGEAGAAAPTAEQARRIEQAGARAAAGESVVR